MCAGTKFAIKHVSKFDDDPMKKSTRSVTKHEAWLLLIRMIVCSDTVEENHTTMRGRNNENHSMLYDAVKGGGDSDFERLNRIQDI